MISIHRCSLSAVIAALFFVCTGCSSRALNQATRAVGEETAYAVLQSALTKAGITSASHMTDAVRLVVDKKDYGGAAAAFAVALSEHNARANQKLTSAQVIGIMRLAAPAVRGASPRVGSGLTAFCDYLSSRG